MKVATVDLPWPPSKTSKNGSQGDWRGKARAAKSYKADCIWCCHEIGLRRVGFQSPRVILTFIAPDGTRDRADLDNLLARAKQGLDGVCEVIGIDDRAIREIVLRRGPVDRKRGRVEVRFEE